MAMKKAPAKPAADKPEYPGDKPDTKTAAKGEAKAKKPQLAPPFAKKK